MKLFNFFCIIFSFAGVVVSCGVKGPPVAPPVADTPIESDLEEGPTYMKQIVPEKKKTRRIRRDE